MCQDGTKDEIKRQVMARVETFRNLVDQDYPKVR